MEFCVKYMHVDMFIKSTEKGFGFYVIFGWDSNDELCDFAELRGGTITGYIVVFQIPRP